jgi:class 3 adenylate cyclase
MEVPDVSYARASGDVAIAYQVVGEGETDLVVYPFLSNIWSLWHLPAFGDFAYRIAEGRRVIVVNPRGVGLSDRPRGFTVESRMDDLLAVMDAVGIERAALLGIAEGAATCAVFAASHPERVEHLLLHTPYARGIRDESDRGPALERLRDERTRWGSRELLEESARRLNPQWADDANYLHWFVWHHRLTSSPAAYFEFRRMTLELDIRDVLPAIRVPTLVTSKELMREDAAEVAALIPGARHVEVPGRGMAIMENDFALEAIEDFLAGASPRRIPDSVLATLLFTDLVGSTERAAALGDSAWRELLARQRVVARRELERYRGSEVDTAGDGLFARFDGPARAIACAREVIRGTRALGLDLRAGIHTGECELVEGKPAGVSVHVGARVSARAEAGEVLVTGTVKDLVAGSGIAFDPRGEHQLKGVPGTWQIYAVSEA